MAPYLYEAREEKPVVQQEKLSKAMSHALRHSPATYGLELTSDGYVEVSSLAKGLSKHFKTTITQEQVLEVVAADSKKRYTLKGKKLRAAQGHSFPVELGLKELTPPAVLYHGTSYTFLSSIKKQGLLPGKRSHVHLSATLEVAQLVGARRPSPTVILVQALEAHEAGVKFFQADNGVWLTEALPAKFLTLGRV